MEDKIYFLFVFAAVVLIAAMVALIYTPLHTTLSGLGTAPNTALSNIEPNSVYGWIDWTVVCIYFALNILICIILPMLVRHNPVYIGIMFLFSFIYALVSAYVANAIVEFLESVGSTYTYTLLILNNFVVIEVVFLLIMTVVMFFKYRSGMDAYYT